jgi:hypothetical protein
MMACRDVSASPLGSPPAAHRPLVYCIALLLFQLGCQVVPKFLVIEPKDYITAVDISADNDPNIPMPKTAGKPVRWVWVLGQQP